MAILMRRANQARAMLKAIDVACRAATSFGLNRPKAAGCDSVQGEQQ